MRSIFSRADSICSGAPLSFICVPRERIFKRGNFFRSRSNFPLFTPKNSMGLTVSRLMIASVNLFSLMYDGINLILTLASVSNLIGYIYQILAFVMHRVWIEIVNYNALSASIVLTGSSDLKTVLPATSTSAPACTMAAAF